MLVIDVQGFKTSEKDFAPKELAVFDGHRVSHYVFKPPFAFRNLPPTFRQQATWLMHNHHCLDWNEGFTPPFMLPVILQRLTQQADTVYVKGSEKSNYIRRFVSQPVVELPEEPALQAMLPSCFYHHHSLCYCALSNVYYLYKTHVMDFSE